MINLAAFMQCSFSNIFVQFIYLNILSLKTFFLCENFKIIRLEVSSDRKGKLRHREENYFLLGTH